MSTTVRPTRKAPPQKVKRRSGLRAKLVRIGNSRGIRLPKAVIEQAGLTDDVEISVRDNAVILRPVQTPDEPRADWDERFKRALEKYGPAEPMDPAWEHMPNKFDEEEWTW